MPTATQYDAVEMDAYGSAATHTVDAAPSVTLRILSGPARGEFVRMTKPVIRLGRGDDNDLVFSEDASVSRGHARLAWRTPHWFLEDSGSKNGTFIERDGMVVRLKKPHALKSGQHFWLGTTEVQVVLREQGAEHDISDTAPVELLGGLRDVLRIRWDKRWLTAVHVRHGIGVQHVRSECTRGDLAALERRVDRLAARTIHEMRSGQSDTAMVVMRDVGRELAQRLLAPELLESIAARTSELTLDIEPRLAGIPWELLDVLGVPLGTMRPVERTVGIAATNSHPMPNNPRCLIISNPTGDLDAVQKAAESLFETLRGKQPSLDIQYLARSRATRAEVVRGLGGADIVYFAGHAEYDAHDVSRRGWRLSDGLLPPSAMQGVERRPWLVFANACDSARLASHEFNGGDRVAARAGLGARHFVGTLWPAPVESSQQIASEFFDRLFSGASPAEALRDARRTMLRRDSASKMAWTTYVLYRCSAPTGGLALSRENLLCSSSPARR